MSTDVTNDLFPYSLMVFAFGGITFTMLEVYFPSKHTTPKHPIAGAIMIGVGLLLLCLCVRVTYVRLHRQLKSSRPHAE